MPPRPDRTADQSLESATTSTRPSRATTARMSSPAEGPHGHLDHAGHGPQGTHRLDYARVVIDQRDHRQVIAELRAESQVPNQTSCRYCRGRAARSRSGKTRRAGRGTASSSRVRSEIRRSRVPYERSRSSVIRLNASERAPISSVEVTRLRTHRSPAATADEVRANRRIGRATPPRDRVGGREPQGQRSPAQPQKQPAQLVDRCVRLGRVDLGDQSPAREAQDPPADRRPERPCPDNRSSA